MTHGARLPPQGVGLKHLTGDVKSMLGRITETDQVGAGEGNLMWRLPLVGVVSVLGHSGDRQASSAQARILNGPAPQNNYPETLGKTVIINAPTGAALPAPLAEGGVPAAPWLAPARGLPRGADRPYTRAGGCPLLGAPHAPGCPLTVAPQCSR